MRNHNPNLVYWCTSGVAVVMGSCSAHWGQDSWNTGGEGGACKYSGCSVGGKRYCTTNFNNIMVQDFWLQSLSAQQIFLLLGNPGREPSFSMFLNHFTIIILLLFMIISQLANMLQQRKFKHHSRKVL